VGLGMQATYMLKPQQVWQGDRPILSHCWYSKGDSMFKSGVRLGGKFHAYLYGPEGELKAERHVFNLIVASGEQHIATRIVGTSEGVMSHIAVGLSGTAPASGDTALGGELEDRHAATGTRAGGGTDANNVRWTTTFASGHATGALLEAGIFNASTGGVMLARVVYDVLNKGPYDNLDITWDIGFEDDGE